MAVASMADGAVRDWVEHVVAWDELHDQGAEGLHHARVARFLQEHAVTEVVANHMGAGMEHMLARMGIAVHFGAAGDARTAVSAALAAPRRPMLCLDRPCRRQSASRSQGVWVRPTSRDSGPSRRETVWPQGSVRLATKHWYPRLFSSKVARATSSTSNSTQAWGMGCCEGQAGASKQDRAASDSGQSAKCLTPPRDPVCR